MHTIHHYLKHIGILSAVFFAAAPVSTQCTEQWFPGEGMLGLNGDGTVNTIDLLMLFANWG